ncbi:MAG TPA: hypothetical protein VK669_01160 [Candidatus Limnocylindrales bacterium]|nr:hypothetical protein [Candidatus Limnocylindrales bacterium]
MVIVAFVFGAFLSAMTPSPYPTASSAPRRIAVDAPLGTMSLVVANDDRSNAILCSDDVLSGFNGRITLFPANVLLPLSGRASSARRDLVYVGDGGTVVAVLPDAPPNVTVGGAARLRSEGIWARYLIELAPAATARLKLAPGVRLRLPRRLEAAPPAQTGSPCTHSIR